MQKSKSIIITLLLIFVISIVSAGCGGGSDNQESETENKQFVVARANDAKLIDPGYAWLESSMNTVYPIYEGLVSFKNDKLEVEPCLATDWEKSEDGKTWTFKLREGVKFHDGTEFNAEAVEFTFNRVLEEDHPMHGVVEGGYSYLKYLMGDIIENVEAVDEYKVEFELNQKFAPFLTYMGYYSQFIVSPAAAEEYGKEFPENPKGTGPFKLAEWKKDEYIKLVKNEDYWGEKPKIDTLFLKVVPENSTRLMELETGKADIIKSLQPEQIPNVKDNEELKYISTPGANVCYVPMNTKKEPLDNVKVRKAINYAINNEKIVDEIYSGLGKKAVSILPPTVFAFDESVGGYDYNPEKAEELLDEAGYSDGFDITFHTFTNPRPYVTKPIQVAEMIRADLKDVGINVDLKTTEYATLSDIMENWKHEMALSGWFDIPYPSNFLKTCGLGGNHTAYKPQELVDIANQALATYDRSEQVNYYQDLQKKLHEGAPIVPIAHKKYTAAYQEDIKGLELTAGGLLRLHHAYKDSWK